MTIKKTLFYGAVAIIIFSGQFLINRNMVTGPPPVLTAKTIAGGPVAKAVASGPGMIYFWAEWCGICAMMQNSVTKVLRDYPGMTVAVKSGRESAVKKYLGEHHLAWPVVNDSDGAIGERYGIRGVPAMFILNSKGNIVFTTVGYSTEIGLRIRLWLAGFF